MATSGRPSAITKLSDAPSMGKRNWLIYGDSGLGKTVLAGTAPKALFLTVEAAGTESAKEQGSAADEWVTDTWEEILTAYKWLKEGGAKSYDTVIVDSLSEMEEACWRDHLEKMADAKSTRNIYKPALEDYQVIGNKIKRLVNQFNRLPANVIYTAHAMRVDVEDTITEEDTTLLMPLLGSAKNGTLSQKVCAMVTLVGLLTVRVPKKKTGDGEEEDTKAEPFRRLYLQGNSRFIAKTRHSALGKFVDRPNIETMLEAVNSKKS